MADHHKIEILCYGDSNTWGTIGRWVDDGTPSRRLDEAHRWTNVLQAELGEEVHVISEGLGGRTTIYPVPGKEWKNGETSLLPCLYSHRPLDLVIIMLGTNDLHTRKDITLEELPAGISRLVDIVQGEPKAGRNCRVPAILLIAPIDVRPSSPEGRTEVYPKFRSEIGRDLSLHFPEVYRRVAEEKGCYFMSAQPYAWPGPADGIHMDGESHVRLGKAVAEVVRRDILPALREEKE